MKKLLLLTSLVLSQHAFAGMGHYHPKKILTCASQCTEEEVRKIQPVAIQTLVLAKEISPSWQNATLVKIEKKQFKKGEEWVSVYNDKTQTDPSKQNLYIFITMGGWLNGSNYTGN